MGLNMTFVLKKSDLKRQLEKMGVSVKGNYVHRKDIEKVVAAMELDDEDDFDKWGKDTQDDFLKEIASLFTESELDSFSFQQFLDKLDVIYAYEPDYDFEKMKGPAKKFWDLYKAGNLKHLEFGEG
jgi:hypothetical protein